MSNNSEYDRLLAIVEQRLNKNLVRLEEVGRSWTEIVELSKHLDNIPTENLHLALEKMRPVFEEVSNLIKLGKEIVPAEFQGWSLPAWIFDKQNAALRKLYWHQGQLLEATKNLQAEIDSRD